MRISGRSISGRSGRPRRRRCASCARAFLPQFIPAGADDATGRMLVLGVFMVLTFAVHAALAER